jgi:predicted  nucleic acid-binding Zn-ribbon protein
VTGVLAGLLALQDLDAAYDQLLVRRGRLPEREQFNTLKARRSELAARCQARQTELDTASARQAGLEAELAACDKKDATLTARLRTLVVPREAEAVQAELHALAVRRSGLEDDALACMDQVEALTIAQAADDEAAVALDAELADAAAALARAEAEVDAAREDLAARRTALAPTVPAELLDRYERLRTHFGGVAVARLEGGRCAGCHLSLPAIELDRIRRLPPDEIVECEQCGRLLVRT